MNMKINYKISIFITISLPYLYDHDSLNIKEFSIYNATRRYDIFYDSRNLQEY